MPARATRAFTSAAWVQPYCGAGQSHRPQGPNTLQAWPLVPGFPNGLTAGLGDDGWLAGAAVPVWMAGFGICAVPGTGVSSCVSSALKPAAVPQLRMSATKPSLLIATMLIGRISFTAGSDTTAATLAAGDPDRACSLSPSSAYGRRPH